MMRGKEKVEVIKVFSDTRLSLSDLLRIACDKIKAKFKTKDFITVLDTHFFEAHDMYVVLFKVPFVSDATSEGSMEIERINEK
jgi:hypothetical protein